MGEWFIAHIGFIVGLSLGVLVLLLGFFSWRRRGFWFVLWWVCLGPLFVLGLYVLWSDVSVDGGQLGRGFSFFVMGAALVVGVRGVRELVRQGELVREEAWSGSYSRAVAQLGHSDVVVRQGGLRALERLALLAACAGSAGGQSDDYPHVVGLCARSGASR